MNRKKQDLLNNPLVKELMMHFAAEYNLAEDNIVRAFERYKQSQQPPKEWEVIQMSWCNQTLMPDVDGRYFYIGDKLSAEELIHRTGAKINSVKRLYDGEVFTVGDELTAGQIVSFVFDDAPKEVGREGMLWVKIDYSSWKHNFLSIQKAKRPLFTTEDGKEIFEGGEYFFVNHEFYTVASVATYDNGWGGALNYPEYKRFSSKEAADEYVANNKPMLSVNDIKKLYAPINPNTGHLIYWDDLIKLAKSKIK